MPWSRGLWLTEGWSDVTGFILDFQRAVIHSMRQLISYERVPDYLPNRSIRIPLTPMVCEGLLSEGGDAGVESSSQGMGRPTAVPVPRVTMRRLRGDTAT